MIGRNKRFVLVSLLVPLLSSCGLMGNYWTKTDNYVRPIGKSLVTDNNTIYSDSLQCIKNTVKTKRLPQHIVSVGNILDYTGKDDLETGRRLTQGASLMVISALSKAGVPQVERFDTAVSEFELKMKDNKLIKNNIAGDKRAYQPIRAGSLVGSKYVIVGGITELNYNIRSNDVDALFDIVSGGLRYYVMNIAMDIRLVDTESLEIISTVSYQKQIIGREVQAGVFEFFDEKLLDVGIGERSLEPMQLAVRAISELAVHDIVSDLYRIPRSHCNKNLKQEPTKEARSFQEPEVSKPNARNPHALNQQARSQQLNSPHAHSQQARSQKAAGNPHMQGNEISKQNHHNANRNVSKMREKTLQQPIHSQHRQVSLLKREF